MRRVIGLYRTSVGKKFFMAVSGVILIGFLIAHMIGNLKVFMGAESFNHYAEYLREVGYPILPHKAGLWIFRIVLLGAVGIHMLSALQVYLQSRPARGGKYKKEDDLSFSYASRTMRWGGLIILAFVVYHLLHFTTGDAHPEFIVGDAYRNVVIGFQNPWVIGAYVVALVMVTFHVYHGLWSAFQTVGANHPRYNPYRRPLALILAGVLLLGFLTVPVGVMTGTVTLEGSSGEVAAAEALDGAQAPGEGGATAEITDMDGGE
jgi:succinate dehydrogenase / fumarate reductase cytochrome b subunit